MSRGKPKVRTQYGLIARSRKKNKPKFDAEKQKTKVELWIQFWKGSKP
jgi:hypothetical protein